MQKNIGKAEMWRSNNGTNNLYNFYGCNFVYSLIFWKIKGERMKDKRYYADVRIEFGMDFDARNKKEAIEFLKDSFKDDYGIDLQDDEIIKLEEVK